MKVEVIKVTEEVSRIIDELVPIIEFWDRCRKQGATPSGPAHGAYRVAKKLIASVKEQ